MAAICTSHSRENGIGCDHRIIIVNLDGNNLQFKIREAELDEMSWTDEDKIQAIKYGLKRLRVAGLSLDNAIGRIIIGEEATNVKQYIVLAKDVVKTNIGTSYVDIPPGLNGERSLIEFTGCTQFRIILNMNAVGSGAWGARLVRDSDNAVLFANANITGAGEKELDTDWQNLPSEANGLILVRLQGKSTTASDDPVFRRCVVLVK